MLTDGTFCVREPDAMVEVVDAEVVLGAPEPKNNAEAKLMMQISVLNSRIRDLARILEKHDKIIDNHEQKVSDLMTYVFPFNNR